MVGRCMFALDAYSDKDGWEGRKPTLALGPMIDADTVKQQLCRFSVCIPRHSRSSPQAMGCSAVYRGLPIVNQAGRHHPLTSQ